MSRTSWCIILWDMELITNIMAILQQSKMIYYKCKAFSNKFDLVLGDICWSVSVTDLDDGRISLEGTSRKNQEQPRRSSSLFHLSFSICTSSFWCFDAPRICKFNDSGRLPWIISWMLPTESFFVDWRWLLMNDTESLAAPCWYLITLMIGTLVVLGLMKILSIFFLEVKSLVYVHHPTLWCNIAQTTILGFASFTETATGPHWFSLPPHPLLNTFRYVW